MNRIWILVLTYNGLADTRKCLDSLRSHANDGHPILVVDNGSTDGTSERVKEEYPWAIVLRVEKNAGPSAGNNRGIEHALAQGASGVLLLNNDTTAEPALLARLQAAAEAYPDFGIIGPVVNFMDQPDVVMTDGTTFNPPGQDGLFVRKPVPLALGDPPRITPVDIVNGCSMLIMAPVVRAIGLFDERFFIYHDESDFCLRAKKAGFGRGIIAEQLVRHKGSATFRDTGKRFARYFDSRNLIYLLRKHDGAGENGRGKLETVCTCFRYLYFRYCLEREDGHPVAADAVIEGLLDGLAGRTGPYDEHTRRRFKPAVRRLFEALRQRPRPFKLRSAASR